MEVWASAANATKSLDRKTVAEAIRGKTIAGTIFGDLAFEPNGQAKHKHTIFKVVDGKTGKLEVVEVACPTEANRSSASTASPSATAP